MAALLLATSALIVLLLGTAHLAITFFGPMLLPRDSQLQEEMMRVPPVISRQTTMWKAWIGFNISHSLGAISFGLIYGYFAAEDSAYLFASPFLLTVGIVILSLLAVVGKVYWFSTPYRGICAALICYIAAIALS